ncbi:Detected protein of unknown function [Hibiscus syriacus]|uniref:3'-5' exonuclease domain-containing protein n=1 Tax=Hibiscus syriacus TaxID=106335 RepID=A0A6A3C1S1_HIBSY|nr:protein RISC-INTERACTING CLEARING 3'-5' EXORIBONUCLEASE 1-like [Hibiscus syriacus]KAE8722836.1 Detected protein of unknown function [Hibiscus syriacus]
MTVTNVTSCESDVDRHIQNFLSDRNNSWKVIGLDIERTFVQDSHETEENSKKKSRVAILELCDGFTCLVIQLPYLDFIPNSLLNFLQLPDFTFVGIGIKETVAKLEEEYGLGCKNAVELGQLAASVMRNPNLAACGVGALANVIIPLQLSKHTSVVFSDWGRKNLNKDQLKVATANAYAFFKIGAELLSRSD